MVTITTVERRDIVGKTITRDQHNFGRVYEFKYLAMTIISEQYRIRTNRTRLIMQAPRHSKNNKVRKVKMGRAHQKTRRQTEEKPYGRKPLGRPRLRGRDNLTTDLRAVNIEHAYYEVMMEVCIVFSQDPLRVVWLNK